RCRAPGESTPSPPDRRARPRGPLAPGSRRRRRAGRRRGRRRCTSRTAPSRRHPRGRCTTRGPAPTRRASAARGPFYPRRLAQELGDVEVVVAQVERVLPGERVLVVEAEAARGRGAAGPLLAFEAVEAGG